MISHTALSFTPSRLALLSDYDIDDHRLTVHANPSEPLCADLRLVLATLFAPDDVTARVLLGKAEALSLSDLTPAAKAALIGAVERRLGRYGPLPRATTKKATEKAAVIVRNGEMRALEFILECFAKA